MSSRDEFAGGSHGGHREPDPALVELTYVNRRRFLGILGSGTVVAGLSACSRSPQQILPYVDQPPEVTPGEGTWYATSLPLDGYATGLLVESRAGRPVKVEGNPAHPASLGATGVYEQALAMGLYDGARARAVRGPDGPTLLPAFRAALDARGRTDDGRGLRFLLEPTSSPLIARAIEWVRASLPLAGFHFHSPVVSAPDGNDVSAQYDFTEADVVLALDADFLAAGPFHLRHARQFADRRGIAGPQREMNRLYIAEPGMSVTGAAADHRLPVRGAQVAAVAAAIFAEVAAARALVGVTGADVLERARLASPAPDWTRAVAQDLLAANGRCVVVPGERQPREVHTLARALNDLLGAAGRTTWLTRTPLLAGQDLGGLVNALSAGEVDTLIIAGVNPVYTSPADFDFATLLGRVPMSLCIDLHETETARACTWFAPALHVLEQWGDARAYDGTLSPVQPLIEPLYGGMSVADVLYGTVEPVPVDGYERLRASWLDAGLVSDEDAWLAALRSGVVPDSAHERVSASMSLDVASALGGIEAAGAVRESGLELVFERDSHLYDGRFASNPWLQELPDPMTKLTWDNAALIGVQTAAELGVGTEDVVRLEHGGRDLEMPVILVPGQAAGTVILRLGGGRRAGGVVAEGAGFDTYRLRVSNSPWLVAGATARSTGARHALAVTQRHAGQEGRPIALETTVDEYRRDPAFTSALRGALPTLYEPWRNDGDQWAMIIDLARCTGCSACVIACQAENNVPVVGKDGIRTGRDMHWLRIDRYIGGEPENPRVIMQPMLCQHCEMAPCEYVCPVNATVHSPDGLNEMIYNRCVGTRFCSNNCPYKVRRFNWFDYHAQRAATERLVLNPDVTVRGRGVIEKCTFCVQRIRRAGIRARMEGRETRAGDVSTACEQACPSRAIVFGSLAHADGPLTERLSDPRRYAVLHELGTRPRVTYLAGLRNPNAALDGQSPVRPATGA